MKEEILIELRKIPTLLEKENIKSFVIFNLNESDKQDLFDSIRFEFINIQKGLDKIIEKEKSKLYSSHSPNFEKYTEIEKRYENSDRLEYVKKLHFEVKNDTIEMISKVDTHGSRLNKLYNFDELYLFEYFKKEKLFSFLSDSMDFTNLINVNKKNPYYLYYRLTDEEKEYEELKEYFLRCHHKGSLVTYFGEYNDNLDRLLNSRLDIKYLNWSFLGFNMSQEEFDNKSSRRTKEFLYSRNTVIYG